MNIGKFNILVLIGLSAIITLQSIWLFTSYKYFNWVMQKECNSILISSLRKEAAIRFRKAPKGTGISGISIPADKNVNEFAPEIISLNEGLSKIGLDISLRCIDSISSILFKEIDIDCQTISFIQDTKTSEYISQSNAMDKHCWIIKSIVMPITEDFSRGVQIGIINPYNTLIKRMAIVFLASILITLLIIICIIYQYKLFGMLKSILQIREDFSYAMIHDMKTPLSTIFMTLNFLHTGRLDDKPEKKEKYFQIAEGEADHLLTLTNKVLTISKLERHKLEMHKEELELEPIIDKLIDKFTAKAEKPVHFIKDLQTEVIYADEEFFEEVLSNLIDNAIKYSKESVGITLSSTSNELYTILKVHDNGLGISDEDQKVIFNKYERAAAGRQKRKKGSSGFGLGLNFVQQVVEAHEGKIIVNSIEGEFTEFVIYLPQIIQKL